MKYYISIGWNQVIKCGVQCVVAVQAAKGVGKALRAFAPTLQELTSVSRDLKNTLDNELGIDEIRRDLASAQVSLEIV